MPDVRPAPPGAPTRRTLALAALGLLAGAVATPRTARADGPRLRLGLLAFGTGSWLVETIRAEGLDRAHDFELVPVTLASNDAARVAFQAGEVDAILSDLLFAARRTADGRPTVFEPFSTAEGALMVRDGAPIRSLGDLKGKKIGVSGGALDKGWLLLRAEAKRSVGLDLARDAEPVFGAPPLLARQLESGDLDAALLFWTFAARLEAKGFHALLRVADLARAFGTKGDPALLGWVFDRGFAAANSALIDRFAAAARAAGDRMERDPAAWERLRPSMRAESEAHFAALERDFLAGRPRRPLAEEEADARILFAALAEIGGPDLVGPATRLPDGLYRTGRDGGS